jgi:hypothetical protein
MAIKFWDKLQGLTNRTWFVPLFFVFIFAVYFSKSDSSFGWTNPKARDIEVIHSDASGYYAYLPQWFIYGTKHFEFIAAINKTYPEERFGDFIGHFSAKEIRTGKSYNKYYSGTAFMLSPFFCIGHWHSIWVKQPQDGYSWPYLLWINIGSICYCVLGLWGLVKLFDLFNVQRIWTLSVILALLFGTNLSFYSNYFIGFSHVFGFALIAWILYFYVKWTRDRKNSHVFWLLILLSLAFIVRPTNILILLALPFFESDWRLWWFQIKRFIRPSNLYLWVALISVALIIYLQIKGVHNQIGKWRFNSYEQEEFNWSDPKIWDILFSYRKGLFIYAPLLLLIIPAVFFLFKRNFKLFCGWMLFFGVLTYVLSSWWCWWYGGGLGARSYIDFFPFLVLPIVLSLQKGGVIWRSFVMIVFLAGSYLYQVYDFQVKEHVLPFDGINKDIFQTVFMKKDLRYGWFYDVPFESFPKDKLKIKRETRFFKNPNREYTGKTVENLKDVLEDDPKITVRSKKDKDSLYFAAFRLNLHVKIGSAGTTPSAAIQYYQFGQVIQSNEIYYGSRIPQVDQWCQVSLELFPKLHWKDFDSVSVRLLEGNTFIHYKSLSITSFSIQKD